MTAHRSIGVRRSRRYEELLERCPKPSRRRARSPTTPLGFVTQVARSACPRVWCPHICLRLALHVLHDRRLARGVPRGRPARGHALFHVNAWGLPIRVPWQRQARLPGRTSAALSLAALIEAERVTVAAAVPTVWVDLLGPASEPYDLSRCAACCAGARRDAVPAGRGCRRGLVSHKGWGMTRCCPAAPCRSAARARPGQPGRRDHRVGSRPPACGCGWSAGGSVLPWDGRTTGELEASGPWVVRAYLDRTTTATHPVSTTAGCARRPGRDHRTRRWSRRPGQGRDQSGGEWSARWPGAGLAAHPGSRRWRIAIPTTGGRAAAAAVVVRAARRRARRTWHVPGRAGCRVVAAERIVLVDACRDHRRQARQKALRARLSPPYRKLSMCTQCAAAAAAGPGRRWSARQHARSISLISGSHLSSTAGRRGELGAHDPAWPGRPRRIRPALVSAAITSLIVCGVVVARRASWRWKARSALQHRRVVYCGTGQSCGRTASS